MPRPELQAPPEIFYNESEARKYTTSSRIIEIQAKISQRAFELLNLPNDGISRLLLDIGCGSGLSGETLSFNGHHWIGHDISESMLNVALDREVEGDLLLADMGQGLGLRPGVIDGAISISAVQWLCYADKSSHEPRLRLKAFFGSLYRCLARGARAVLQLYAENMDQSEMIMTYAMRAGFAGGIVVDWPHSSKARKAYLVLTCGPPSARTSLPKGKGEDGEMCSEDEDSGDEEQTIATEEKDKILGSIPSELKEKGSMLYISLLDGKGGLQNLIGSIMDKDPDKVSVGLASSLDTVAELELLQAPGLSFLLPQQYMTYPRLTGRATVEFTIGKVEGSTFFPSAGGDPKTTANILVVIDGYSAPLTSGNFAKLVIDGAYDGVKLKCASQAILSDNELDNNGYSVPLEVKPSGQFEPLYKTTLNVQDGELPVLPLSVYGAVAMAHNIDSDEYSSPTQFFFYLYDKRNSGLGGLSFDEGQFSVFGYIVAGKEILPQIKTGDIIQSAKLVQGKDRLILPDES